MASIILEVPNLYKNRKKKKDSKIKNSQIGLRIKLGDKAFPY